MERRRVVVTGIGTVTPLGINTSETWAGVRANKCGIAPIEGYDTSEMKVKLAGEVAKGTIESIFDKREIRKTDRCTMLAMIAADEAIKDCNIAFSEMNTDRCGVIFSSGIGGVKTIQTESARGFEKGFDRVSPFFIPTIITNITAGQLAIRYGFRGMCSCVVTACASGNNAIGDAFRNIRDNYTDIMLCGGAEAAVCELPIGGFTSMHALSTATDPSRASIPFDKERSGFVMGEGAGALILEEYEHAKARGAKIYAEIIGYGSNCDAHHITAPMDTGAGAAACMNMAMADANVQPTDIDYINAHGTSTPLGDKAETLAVKKAMGAHVSDVKISSTKSMTGHLLGASGAVESIFSIMSIYDSFIPATLNYQVPDEDCDLQYVPNEGIEQRVDCALTNSFGFGGHNASLIFRKVEV